MDLFDGPRLGDAFGEYLACRLRGEEAALVYERDDGLVNVDTNDYFEGPQAFGDLTTWVLERALGRVLDVGAGGGRASLYLQEMGYEVVALDVSPGAVSVCRERGVKATFLGTVAELAKSNPEPFDTFVLLGNNLGLLATPAKATAFLTALGRMASPMARILGTAGNWSLSPAPSWHAGYHDRNRQAGREPGEIRLRTRFRNVATDWIELLLMSPQELDRLARGAGWSLLETSDGQFYAAHLQRG